MCVSIGRCMYIMVCVCVSVWVSVAFMKVDVRHQDVMVIQMSNDRNVTSTAIKRIQTHGNTHNCTCRPMHHAWYSTFVLGHNHPQVIHKIHTTQLLIGRLDLWLLQSLCQSTLGQGTEPKLLPLCSSEFESVCGC